MAIGLLIAATPAILRQRIPVSWAQVVLWKSPTEARPGALRRGQARRTAWKILQEAYTMHLATPGTLQRG